MLPPCGRVGLEPQTTRWGCGSGVQATDGTVVDHLQVHLVSHQFSDVVDAVLDHGGSGGQTVKVRPPHLQLGPLYTFGPEQQRLVLALVLFCVVSMLKK